MPAIQYLATIFFNAAANVYRGLWQRVGELLFGIVLFFVELLVLTMVLYIAGRIVAGEKRTSLASAFAIALLGSILSSVFVAFIPYSILALFLSILVWLLLIKRLYKTGWLGAIAIGILAIIIFIAILVLLALLFGIFHIIYEWLIAPIL